MKHLAQHQFWRIAILITLNAVFFATTDPLKVPSFVIIVSFGLLAVSLYLCSVLLLRLASLYGLPLQRRGRRIAAVTSGLITALVSLQSIGQLGRHDILVVLPLCLVGYVYLSYTRSARGVTTS